MSEVLVNVTRGSLVESRHRGDLAVVDTAGRLVYSRGDPHLVTYWRSSAKPFQALTLVEEGGPGCFGLTARELAVIVSSHGGEEEHVQTVASVLAKTGCAESDLLCGAAAPLYAPAAENLMRAKVPFRAVHNNCSGKHAGMLALCRLKGWSPAGYTDPGHPLQRHTLAVIADLTGVLAAQIAIGVDGCGVPVFGLPLSGMALAYARLARPEALASGARRRALAAIRAAMVEHPFFVAGTGRLDTALMEATAGRLAAKVGAEGVYCVAGPGQGLALKIEDGGNRPLGPAVIQSLRDLGWLTDEESARLEPFWHPAIRNHRGEVVGALEPATK